MDKAAVKIANGRPGKMENECKTGLNPSGQCGAAFYCAAEYSCCAECPDWCNSKCGCVPDPEKKGDDDES